MEISNSVKENAFPNLSLNHSMEISNSSVLNKSLSLMPANCLMKFPNKPGFAERAARYSSFCSENYKEVKVSILESDKLSRVSSSQDLKSKDTSSVNDFGFRHGECNGRKRKATSKGKTKVIEETNMNVKKCLSAESEDEKFGFQLNEEQNGEENKGKDNVLEISEPHKGYIHVRARRGEATDSHSLAERVRREKISQRMKVLQDLVPGCNKITGKAVMLDEIINYVQSLQRQVEFLSMKLATLNPRLDCNLANFFSKEPLLSQTNASLPSSIYPLDNSAATFPCTQQFKEENSMHFGVIKSMETHLSFSQVNCTLYQAPYLQPTSIDVFGAPASQLGNTWDDDLHSIIQMNLVQN